MKRHFEINRDEAGLGLDAKTNLVLPRSNARSL